jgi:hypothetical protein
LNLDAVDQGGMRKSMQGFEQVPAAGLQDSKFTQGSAQPIEASVHTLQCCPAVEQQ